MNDNNKELKRAVALSYDSDVHIAPKVVAIGDGFLAEQIVAIAKEHDIPLYQDKELATALNVLNYIPPALYQVVAKILTCIYKQNKSIKQKSKTAFINP